MNTKQENQSLAGHNAAEAEQSSFSIQALLPYKLYHISAIHERIVYSNMTRDTGITLPEWRIMGNICGGINTFSGLQKELLVDQGQLSNSIKLLQAKGIIQKQRSGEDKRKFELSLTPKGMAKKEFIQNMAAEYEVMALAGLDQMEREILAKSLVKVEANLKVFWEQRSGK